MVNVCLFLSSVLKPFDKCIIRMQVNEAIFHTFERSWSQPRFVLFKNKTKIGDEENDDLSHDIWCDNFASLLYSYAAPIFVLKPK
jgi:hypothetical protein